MPDRRRDRDSGRRRERSLSSESEDGSPRHQRTSHRSHDRDPAYEESMPGRRRQYSPIDGRRDRRRNSFDPSRSPIRRDRLSRNEYDEPERRRRKHSFASDYYSREFRDDHKRSRQRDIESRSSSPRRGSDSRGNITRDAHYDRKLSRVSATRRPEGDSREPHRHHARNRNRSRSRPGHHARTLPAQISQPKRSHAPLPSQEDAFSGKSLSKSSKQDLQPRAEAPPEKQKPNYTPSGKLAAETNTVANTSIILKYNEPHGAGVPPASSPWRLYIFKGESLLETLPIHTRSCWLFGRERLAVDCPTEHPSCSKQHAVIQFRSLETKNEYGDKEGGIRPYILDLESANGTKVNGELVPGSRYVELKDKDVITFGESTREYVLILPPKE